jgi:hypothetical protein
MEDPVDGAELRASQEVVRATPRWLAGVAIFLLGVGVGALAFGLDTSDPDAAVEDSIAVGCGAQVTLIVDAKDLPAGICDRMLHMINSMMYPLIGAHRGHQWVLPDDGRLLLVANVPIGKGNDLRYELVGDDSKPVFSGSLNTSSSER